MRVNSPLLERMHLDPAYALLSMQNIMTAMQIFGLLDVHAHKCLNDAVFDFFVRGFTDLTAAEVPILFSLLDVDQSGEIEFDEFYLLFCILIACKDQYEKEFIYRHSRSIFQLIDSDDSGQISRQEFANMGILFNFDKRSVSSIFNEFDISGDKQLDFREFRLFTMACIDEQRIIDAHKKVNAFREYNQRLIYSLSPTVKRYIQSQNLPPPIEIESAVDATQPPFIVRHYYHMTVKDALKKVFGKVWAFIKSIFAPMCRCCRLCLSKSKEQDLADFFFVPDEKNKSCCKCCRTKRKKSTGYETVPSTYSRPHETASGLRAPRKSTQLFDLHTALQRANKAPELGISKKDLGLSRAKVFHVKRFD